MARIKTIGLIHPRSPWHRKSKRLRGKKVEVLHERETLRGSSWLCAEVQNAPEETAAFHTSMPVHIVGIRFLED